MSNTREERLLGVVAEVLDRSNEAWRELAGGDIDEAIHTIVSEARDAGMCARASECRVCSTDSDWWLVTLCYDIIMMQCADLALIALEAERSGKRVYWHRFSAAPEPELVLQALSISLFNAMKGVRRLVCEGTDACARILLRYAVELSDLLLAITADSEMFKRYRRASGSPATAYRHWRKGLAPGLVRQVCEDLDRGAGVPPEVLEEVRRMRMGTYKWLSAFAHGTFAGQAFSAFVQTEEAPDRVVPALSDDVVAMSRSTLVRGVVYTGLSLYMVRSWLVQSHKWYGLRGDPTRSFFMFRGELLMTVILGSYDHIIGFTDR